MIAVVDYCKGNLKSVQRGLSAVGADALITADPEVIRRADAIVLPGVGAFADAMTSMKESGQVDAIMDRLDEGAPFLGICLGQQLLFEAGTEGAPEGGTVEGLGIMPGVATRLPNYDAEGVFYKIPHVGWNSIGGIGLQEASLEARSDRAKVSTSRSLNLASPLQTNPTNDSFSGESQALASDLQSEPETESTFDCPLFKGIPEGEYFYFTHSFVAPESPYTVATTTHSITFPSAVQKDNIFGVQFHPEKSSDAGLAVLRNFTDIVAGLTASR